MIAQNKFTNIYSWKNMQSTAGKSLWCVHVLLKPLGNPSGTVLLLMGTLINETKINSLAPLKTQFYSHLSVQSATLCEILWRCNLTETLTLGDSLQEGGLVFYTSLQGTGSGAGSWDCAAVRTRGNQKLPYLMHSQFLLHSSFRGSHHQQPPTYTRARAKVNGVGRGNHALGRLCCVTMAIASNDFTPRSRYKPQA